MKDGSLDIKISQDKYVCGIEGCEKKFYGGLIMNKGDKSLATKDLEANFNFFRTLWVNENMTSF